MIITESGVQVEAPQNNQIIGDFEERNTRVTFKGTGNILFCEKGARLDSCNITFCSSDAVVYLSANTKHWTKMKIDAWRGVSVYVGANNYFNGILTAIVSERKNLFIGGDGVFSFGVWIRTADPHLLYSVDTKERLNPSRSVLIGDHVWLGQNATILKGTSIGSGSVLAAGAVISGKTVPSNSVWGGNPAAQIREGVFFDGASVHDYTEEKTAASMRYPKGNDDYIFADMGGCRTLKDLDAALEGKFAEERLAVLRAFAAEKAKDRFYAAGAGAAPKKTGFFGRR